MAFLFASCGLVTFFVVFLNFLCFFHPSKKDKIGHSKNKNAEKWNIFSVSAVVFTNSVPNFFGWA